jgi:hypothetical protein
MSSPLFAYTAPAARTGKSYLVDIACVISHGHSAPVVVASSTFEELDKQLQAAVISGHTIIPLDNQNSDDALRSDLLCQMLTQDTVEIRCFGQNKELKPYPSIAVVSVTGNNLAVAKDLTERTLLCQLDANMEVPGARKFSFNPVVMARQNRVILLRACLTILRAYHIAGRPTQNIQPMGGFDGWSDWIRSALIWLGAADPCDTMAAIRSKDQSRGVHIEIMEQWEKHIGYDVEVSASDVAKKARTIDANGCGDPDFNSALWMTAGKVKNLPMALGKWLASKNGVVIDGRKLVERKGRARSVTYHLESVGD